MTIGFRKKKGLKRIGEKNCRSYTLASPCVSLWESRRLGRRRWNFYTYFSSCHLSHKRRRRRRRRGAAQRVQCNANEWPCHVHAHCNFSFHDCNPHRRSSGAMVYVVYVIIIIIIIWTYTYNIIYIHVLFIIICTVNACGCMVCVCVYLHVLLYLYIYNIYNMSYVGLSRGPLLTYGEMYTFLHPTVTTLPRQFTMFVLLWELIIWILQISTQILLYAQRFG